MVIHLIDLEKSFDEQLMYQDELNDVIEDSRRVLVDDLIIRMQQREREWQETFKDILNRSQEENNPAFKDTLGFNLKPSIFLKPETSNVAPQTNLLKSQTQTLPIAQAKENSCPEPTPKQPIKPDVQKSLDKDTERTHRFRKENREFNDPEFSNYYAVQEFLRIQEIMTKNRESLSDINTNPTLKPYRNELNLFIRTQINTISNDVHHLNSKISNLTNLFRGNPVAYQNRQVCSTRHHQGQLYCLDQTAQTIVTVGTRLVNSVPEIARSMATLVNSIANELPIFRDLVIGHLQQRCPFVVPLYPDPTDLAGKEDADLKHKIACGYSYDPESKTLESDEKYLARIRSMVLIYACILSSAHAWSWLASFLSLYPEPVITPTVLQAFLQMSSQEMSKSFGSQFDKLLAFIRSKYVPMTEELSTEGSDKQPLVKLKNLLSDESSLIGSKPVGSIFGALRF